jgi:hypothetical protein
LIDTLKREAVQMSLNKSIISAGIEALGNEGVFHAVVESILGQIK